MGMLNFLLALVIITIIYVLPIVHVIKSNRTTDQMRAFWVICIVITGLLGYLLWWLMTAPQPTAAMRDVSTAPEFPDKPDENAATLYVLRSSFFGALVLYSVYLDDHDKPPVAQIRGRGRAKVTIPPGKHTLWVKGYRWLEFPFEAHAGDMLAFSLNTQAETPLTNTVAGWLDEGVARRLLAG